MYWPFFRSKQEELLALKELGPKLSNLIVPIIKPHAAGPRVEGQIGRVLETGLRIALIMNTNEGAPIPSLADVAGMEKSLEKKYKGQVFPALEVRPGINSNDVAHFVRAYKTRALVFVHRAHTLPAANFSVQGAVQIINANAVPESLVNALPKNRNVLLRDGFQRQQVNGSYPAESHFDDLAYTYTVSGWNGFGDFAAIGDVPYSKGGGEPSHVALHLTEPNTKNQSIKCLHFVSTVPSDSTDRQTKYFDSLQKLVNYTGIPGAGALATEGVSDYCANHAEARFPGLGCPKRWSTKHHIELLHNYLVGSGATAWV